MLLLSKYDQIIEKNLGRLNFLSCLTENCIFTCNTFSFQLNFVLFCHTLPPTSYLYHNFWNTLYNEKNKVRLQSFTAQNIAVQPVTRLTVLCLTLFRRTGSRERAEAKRNKIMTFREHWSSALWAMRVCNNVNYEC